MVLAERKFGSDHPAVAKALNNLATLYFVQGRDADAEPLFKYALIVLKRALGPDHLDVVAARNYLAGLQIERVDAADYRRHAVGTIATTTSASTATETLPR